MTLAKMLRRILACFGLGLLLWGLSGSVAKAGADYTKEDLQGRSFAGQDISGISFVKANLRQSDLSNVTALGTNLFGANLHNADLHNANLRDATLDTADLTGADLRGAVLEGGLMWLAKVQGAQIEGTDFTDALLRKDAVKILCETASGINPTTKRATRDTLGCA